MQLDIETKRRRRILVVSVSLLHGRHGKLLSWRRSLWMLALELGFEWKIKAPTTDTEIRLGSYFSKLRRTVHRNIRVYSCCVAAGPVLFSEFTTVQNSLDV